MSTWWEQDTRGEQGNWWEQDTWWEQDIWWEQDTWWEQGTPGGRAHQDTHRHDTARSMEGLLRQPTHFSTHAPSSILVVRPSQSMLRASSVVVAGSLATPEAYSEVKSWALAIDTNVPFQLVLTTYVLACFGLT
jgi:hypothetical protein